MTDTRRPDELLRDEFVGQVERTFSVLAGAPDVAAERALDRAQRADAVVLRLQAEAADTRTVADPAALTVAHQDLMRALEVLDRDGHRAANTTHLGPLNGIANAAVSFVARYIIRSYTREVVTTLRRVYARREAQTEAGSAARKLLAARRVEVDRVLPEYAGGGISTPLLLAAGGAAPVIASGARYLGGVDFGAAAVLWPLIGFLILLFVGTSGAMLGGAVLARQRARPLVLDPLTRLWAALGRAGEIPEDVSKTFAAVAVVLTVVAWVVIPVGGAVVFVLL